MTSTTETIAPRVQFYEGRQEAFLGDGVTWHRATVEEAARIGTGCNSETKERHLGVYISPRPNGLVRVGWDLWRLNFNLRPAAVERIEARWRKEATSLSKAKLRSIARRAHFSKSFARCEILPEHLEAWKSELESVLTNPESFEPLQRRPAAPATPEHHEQL